MTSKQPRPKARIMIQSWCDISCPYITHLCDHTYCDLTGRDFGEADIPHPTKSYPMDEECSELQNVINDAIKEFLRSRPANASRNILDTDLCVCGLTEVQCKDRMQQASAKAIDVVLKNLREWSIIQYEISGVIDTMTLKQKIEQLLQQPGGEQR